MPVSIYGAVEGAVDEAILRRLVMHVGAVPGPVFGKNGKRDLRQRLPGYNRAAALAPWLVLVDLNADASCAPPLKANWLPTPASLMCFRVAVRESEAWLFADRERIAGFLRVARNKVPQDPEALADPKLEMVNLAARSRAREIREDMVPRPGSGRSVGPAHTSRLIEFASDAANGWRPQIGAQVSESLSRCITRLRALTGRAQGSKR